MMKTKKFQEQINIRKLHNYGKFKNQFLSFEQSFGKSSEGRAPILLSNAKILLLFLLTLFPNEVIFH